LPTTCGLIAVVWLVVVQPRSPRFTLISLAAVGTAVVLTRTIFHPVWLVLLLAATWWVLRRTVDRRTVVVTVAIPLLLAGGWMVKNEVMFGRPTLSSWFGMNLQRAVVPIATDAQLAGWAAAGGISEITAAFPNGFVSYSGYEPYIGPCVPKHSNPAVANTTRGGPDDPPNFNSECFLPLYDLAGKDAWWVITRHPSLYLEGRWWALRAWVAEAPPPLVNTSPIYRALPKAYRVIEVQVPATIPSVRWAGLPYGAFDNPTRYSVVQALTTLLVIGAAVRALWRRLRKRPSSRWALLEVVAGLIVAWNLVVGVLFELGEQFRFRATTDPITISIGVWIAWRIIAELRRRRTPLPESVA
ncbi:MAG: hypothetical protein QOC57_751, partial [Ilumatobacteraceae bacterium]